MGEGTCGGNCPIGGSIAIDGTSKRFMGAGSGTVIAQNTTKVNCTQTIYTFSDQAVRLAVTFTAPKLLDEFDAVSRPVNCVTFDVVSLTSTSHSVQIAFNAAGGWVVGSATGGSQTIDFGNVDATPVSRHI